MLREWVCVPVLLCSGVWVCLAVFVSVFGAANRNEETIELELISIRLRFYSIWGQLLSLQTEQFSPSSSASRSSSSSSSWLHCEVWLTRLRQSPLFVSFPFVLFSLPGRRDEFAILTFRWYMRGEGASSLGPPSECVWQDKEQATSDEKRGLPAALNGSALELAFSLSWDSIWLFVF